MFLTFLFLYEEQSRVAPPPGLLFILPVGQSVSLSVGTPLIEGLCFKRGGGVKYIVRFPHDALNLAGLEAAPLHGGYDIASAGPPRSTVGKLEWPTQDHSTWSASSGLLTSQHIQNKRTGRGNAAV